MSSNTPQLSAPFFGATFTNSLFWCDVHRYAPLGRYGASGPTGPDNSAALKGLFYGGDWSLLKAQCIGSAIITISTFSVAMLVMWLVNLTGTLRVSKEGEMYGLDLHEHGINAYPEYVISALGTPGFEE